MDFPVLPNFEYHHYLFLQLSSCFRVSTSYMCLYKLIDAVHNAIRGNNYFLPKPAWTMTRKDNRNDIHVHMTTIRCGPFDAMMYAA